MWALLLACSAKPELSPEPAPSSPNIILITLDTTRADALGVYGGPESPHFDALAARGTRFQWALSHASTTLNAHTSLFTGLDPHGHAVPRNGFTLPENLQTLASRLRNGGWDTIGIAAASALDEETQVDRGFRLYDDDLPIDKGKRYEAPGDDVTRRALASVDERLVDRPLFLFVHYYDAHSPYEAPDGPKTSWEDPERAMIQAAKASRDKTITEDQKRELREMYQAEVLYQDAQMGELLAGLEQRGLLEDAFVVITADHGEMFFENRVRPVGHGSDIDLPITRVPLVITGPEVPTGIIDQPVKLSDIASTVLALVGLDLLGSGQNLLPLLQGEPLKGDPIFLEATRPGAEVGPAWNNLGCERGLVSGGHLLINSTSNQYLLYQLDTAQTRVTEPMRSTRMAETLSAWDEEAPEYRPETMSDQMREALRALGYMDED